MADVENKGKTVEITASDLMRRAIKERDDLNVFIKILVNSIHGRDFTDFEMELIPSNTSLGR